MKRLALVGGSSAGIGLGIAEGLLAAGQDVILTARGEARLKEARARLQKAYPASKVDAVVSDFSSAESVRSLIASVQTLGRPVDVLVLNTGGPPAGAFSQITLEQWDAAYQQLFRAPMALAKAFVPGMAQRKWGRVINVSSSLMIEPTAPMILSCGTRAMLANALKCLSIEVAKDGVTVNTVCPAAVLTDRLISLFNKDGKRSKEEVEAEIAKNLPIGRVASPKEFSELAVFLASDKASYLTGQVIPVDGGAVKKGW